jgi:hypothetical protein
MRLPVDDALATMHVERATSRLLGTKAGGNQTGLGHAMAPSLGGAGFDESEHQLRSDELLVHVAASIYRRSRSWPHRWWRGCSEDAPLRADWKLPLRRESIRGQVLLHSILRSVEDRDDSQQRTT